MNGFNFNERVRKVLQLSREAAQGLNHEYIGTEHLLLGILLEGEGVAALALQNLNVNPDDLERKIRETVKPAAGLATNGPYDLPYTSRAKKVMELAFEEARELKHGFIGTEHFLLGMIREEKGIAAAVLLDAGLTLDTTRKEVLRIISSDNTSNDDSRVLVSFRNRLVSLAGAISADLGMSLTPDKIRALRDDPDLKKKIVRALGGGEHYSS